MTEEFIATSKHTKIPAPILLKFSIIGIDVYSNQNTKGTVANFFRKKATSKGEYPDGNHIGYIQYENVNDLYEIFAARYPEETL